MQFYSKNKFEKLVHLVGFIIRITRSLRHWIVQWDLDQVSRITRKFIILMYG